MCFWKKKKDPPLIFKDFGDGNGEITCGGKTTKVIYFSEAAVKHIEAAKKRMSK